MRPTTIAAVVAFFALVACSSAPPSDSASTSKPRPQGGIGGTGTAVQTATTPQGGIGGTGIFGTVTGFGSIVVNDLVIDTAAVDEQAVDLTALSVGSTVLVEASTTQTGIEARHIEVFHPIQGPIAAKASDALSVLGTAVRLSEETIVFASDGRPMALQRLEPGTTVAVSGIWRQGGVDASRIDVLDNNAPSAIRGLLSIRNGLGRIAGTSVVLPPGHGLPALGYAHLTGEL